MITVICWLVFCYLVGKYAEKKGRSFWSFAILSAVLSPLIGFIIALFMGRKDPQVDNVGIDEQYQQQPLIEGKKEFCSGCGHEIPAGSNNCPYCGQKQN